MGSSAEGSQNSSILLKLSHIVGKQGGKSGQSELSNSFEREMLWSLEKNSDEGDIILSSFLENDGDIIIWSFLENDGDIILWPSSNNGREIERSFLSTSEYCWYVIRGN